MHRTNKNDSGQLRCTSTSHHCIPTMHSPRWIPSRVTKLLASASLVSTLAVSTARAHTTGTSLSLNFAATDPDFATSGLASGESAGAIPSSNWNNLTNAAGSLSSLFADSSGVKVSTPVTVNWSSPNTWRSGANNGFPAGPNRKLMSGYLDTGNTAATGVFIAVSNLPPSFTDQGYEVYVYLSRAATDNSGGAYTITNQTGIIRKYGSTLPTATSFVEDPGTDLDNSQDGSYLRFTGLSGNWFTLKTDTTLTTPNGTRAPVNALEIVALPGCTPAGIATPPVNRSACSGSTVMLTVSATGSNPTFQWRRNGVNLVDGPTGNGSVLSGCLSPTLIIGNSVLADSAIQTEGYDCVIAVGCNGTSTNTDRVALTINQAVTVFTVTGGGTDCTGTGVPVGLSGSELGVDYRLRTNGVPTGVVLAGTGSALSFGNQLLNRTYAVAASNTFGGCTALMAGTVGVTNWPITAITSGPIPASFTNYEGGYLTFLVNAVGTNLTFQWRRDGTNLVNNARVSGATTSNLTIFPAQPTDSATAGHGYTCLISNVCGVFISPEAITTVTPFVAVPENFTGVWSNRYNGFGGAAELAGWTAIDANSNVIVVGSSDALLFGKDFLTIKYSSAGAPVWTNRYNGPGNRDDAPAGVAVDSSGNVIVTGYSWNGTNDDYYTAKYAAADGALLWEQRYNSPSNSTDQAVAVAVDALGNALVTGRSVHNNSQYDYKTIKYAAVDGAVLWESRHDGTNSSSDEPLAIAVDANGDAVVTGQTWNGANYDIYTAKYAAANGALVWERQYDEPIYSDDVDYVAALALDPDGNVVIAGRTRTFLQSDFYVAKYAAADGAVLWSKQYNGGVSYNSIRQDQATSVALDSSGNVAVTGRATDSAGREDYLTTKYAADGTFLWQKRFAGSPDLIERPTTVKADGAGNVIVSGLYTVKYDAANGAVTWTNLNSVSSVSMGVDPNGDVVIVGTSAAAGQNDLLTVKCAGADGAIVWEQRYDGPGNHEDTPKCVAIDAAGNVVVAGNSVIPGISATLDFYTTKYSPAGAVLWSRSYGNTNGISDDLISMALDPLGNVAVTGNSGGDYYTAKYAAADGSLLWEQGYANVANNIDEPRAVAADLAGNVIVTGRSYASATGFDYYTAKYAATDGSLLWERRYSGVASSQTDEASAVIVDGVGDVYVTGNSYGGANQDIYTAKYAAADGALIWEKRYNGSANINDYGKSLCLDPNGNVIITGRSSNGSNDDYYTAKYAGSDGALQWEQRFNSGASDTPTAIASDPVGNAIVTGFSQGSYCLTMKYDGGSGWPLWSQRLTNANQNFDFPIATDATGDVIVAAWLYAGGKTDFHTVKLASENGALLWSAVYNGPVNGNDQFYSSRALSVGPAGEIVVAGGSDGQLNYNSVGNRDFFTIKYIAAVAANARPVVQNPIPDANITYGTPVNFTFAANAFNDPDAGQTLTYSAIGMPPGITLTPATRTFSGTPTVVGTNSVTVIATDNGSPALSTNDVFDIVIAKAPLTATANNQSRTYAETNLPLTFSYSAFALGETAAVLDTPPVITTAATNGSPVGPYPITIAGGADDHYAFSYVGGMLNITPAALSVTADNTNRIYGAPNPAFTGGITGLAHGDNITATFGSSADTNTPPGIYPIIPALVDPDAKLGNYTVTTNPGTLTVTAAPLTVTANDTNRVYGAADPAFTGSLLGLVNGDNITATFTTTATIASPPGTYPITPVLSDPDGKLGNYFVTTNSGTLTVTSPPELSFTLGGGGGGLFTLSWPSSYAGFILESTESLTPPLAWQEVTNGITENGGTKSYTVTNDSGVTGRLYRLRLP